MSYRAWMDACRAIAFVFGTFMFTRHALRDGSVLEGTVLLVIMAALSVGIFGDFCGPALDRRAKRHWIESRRDWEEA